jgi:hypothetical protein
MYSEIARFADPLNLSESAAASPAGGMTFGECFTGTGAGVALDRQRFRQFVAGEVSERLPVALSAVLAEVMADVAEFKFLADHPDQHGLLPTSSRFPLFPAKLDLTFQDIPFYFNQATKVFRQWARQPVQRERTVRQLVSRGASEAAAERAVAEALAIWEELAGGFYAAVLDWKPTGDGHLQVNAFTRVVLNFVGLHRAVLETYREVGELSPADLPLKSFRDLLVIGASVFFGPIRPGTCGEWTSISRAAWFRSAVGWREVRLDAYFARASKRAFISAPPSAGWSVRVTKMSCAASCFLFNRTRARAWK